MNSRCSSFYNKLGQLYSSERQKAFIKRTFINGISYILQRLFGSNNGDNIDSGFHLNLIEVGQVKKTCDTLCTSCIRRRTGVELQV